MHGKGNDITFPITVTNRKLPRRGELGDQPPIDGVTLKIVKIIRRGPILKHITGLERKAGRILANGWPTGVEVTHAMVHGGPWPATSDPRTTSVGSLAIDRFLRPVCYQNLPAELLPAELRDDRASELPRLYDGKPG